MTNSHSSVTTESVVILTVARCETGFSHAVSALLDAGAKGSTVIEGRGLSSVLSNDFPVFAALSALLPPTVRSRVIVTVTTSTIAESFGRFIRQLPSDEQPIVAVLPISSLIGIGP